MREAFAYTSHEVLDMFGVNADAGLSADEVSKRRIQFGENQISYARAVSKWKLLARQFKSPLVVLLLLATGLSFLFNEWLDGIAILVVIVINAVIGFLMEFKASRSLEALNKLSTQYVRVLRNSKLSTIKANELVPGDMAFFEAGDVVSADARICKQAQLQANESSLTGESLPVNKITSPLPDNTLLADQRNMLFKGTYILRGNAWAVVTKTGMNTELGKIAHLVQREEQAATPLEEKLEQFSRQMINVTSVLVAIIFFVGWIGGRELIVMLQTSIALGVAAIPEGLPIVATIALANGMIRMAANNVIVRKLSAIETLGGTNVICTDKTGTLTENRMTVVDFPKDNATHSRLIDACILCNTAEIDPSGNESGDPLEIALLNFIQSPARIAHTRAQFPKLREVPFSSETKRMATAHQHDDRITVFAKGASEEIVQLSNQIFDQGVVHTLDDNAKQNLLTQAHQLSSRGYKVIAFAFTEHAFMPEDLFSELIFLGFVSLIDPPRKNIAKDIEECKLAGIKVIMVTGDHAATAAEIARQIGIQPIADATVINGSSMKAFDKLNTADKQMWMNTTVFARVTPVQKLDLVKVFQEAHCVVGMTGDGINDAPALKKADIGIAMGMRGTQVAQEVADMVLKDDSFSSIVTAIREGRIIFENIRKFVIFLLSCNLSELMIIATCAIFNLHFQLLPLQILFINIITDVLPALALGLTRGGPAVMKKFPRQISEPIIDTRHWRAIIGYSIVITISCIVAVYFVHTSLHDANAMDHRKCNSILFITLIVTQLLHVFNMNSAESGFLHSGVFRNKFIWYALLICFASMAALFLIPVIRTILSVTILSVEDWTIVAGSSALSLVTIQFAKRRRWMI